MFWLVNKNKKNEMDINAPPLRTPHLPPRKDKTFPP